MSKGIESRRLTAAQGRPYLSALAEVLFDWVEGGASVSFMAPFSRADAESFFEKVLDGVHRGERILLAPFIGSELVGTVQIVTATPPNQPHRADVAKLLVLRLARGRGAGAGLMKHAEEVCWMAGKTLLMLDTVAGGSGEALYLRLGWNRMGTIPKYALFPDGRWCDAVLFWKQLD